MRDIQGKMSKSQRGSLELRLKYCFQQVKNFVGKASYAEEENQAEQ
jgi:hypothetical protein